MFEQVEPQVFVDAFVERHGAEMERYGAMMIDMFKFLEEIGRASFAATFLRRRKLTGLFRQRTERRTSLRVSGSLE